MHADRLPLLLIAGFAVIAVILGIVVTGGPGAGRMERRDRDRHADMRDLKTHVACLADRREGLLPDTLETAEGCFVTPDQLTDPLTGAPYRYRVLDAARYEICADFEQPEDATTYQINQGFDTATGCYQFFYEKE